MSYVVLGNWYYTQCHRGSQSYRYHGPSMHRYGPSNGPYVTVSDIKLGLSWASVVVRSVSNRCSGMSPRSRVIVV